MKNDVSHSNLPAPLPHVMWSCHCSSVLPTCLSPSGGHPLRCGRRPASRGICDSCCSMGISETCGPKQQLPVPRCLCHQRRKLSETLQGPAAVSPPGDPGRTVRRRMGKWAHTVPALYCRDRVSMVLFSMSQDTQFGDLSRFRLPRSRWFFPTVLCRC